MAAIVGCVSLAAGASASAVTGESGPGGGATVAILPVCTTPFSDVDHFNPFCDDVRYLVDRAITGGYSDGTFRPAAGVSRQALMAWLYTLPGLPPPVGACDTSGGFSDVPASHPFCQQIMFMVHSGYASGYPDGTFRPSALVTRQAMASFLFRGAGRTKAASCAGTPFIDVPVSHPFCQEIAWMASVYITNGYADGSFRPTGTITRQAGAAFIHRFATMPPPI